MPEFNLKALEKQNKIPFNILLTLYSMLFECNSQLFNTIVKLKNLKVFHN